MKNLSILKKYLEIVPSLDHLSCGLFHSKDASIRPWNVAVSLDTPLTYELFMKKKKTKYTTKEQFVHTRYIIDCTLKQDWKDFNLKAQALGRIIALY